MVKIFTFVLSNNEVKKMKVMRIQNSTPHTFSPASQSEIRNAMANFGVNEVVTHTNRPHDEVDNIFNFFNTDGEYLFSIDVDGDVIFENQYARQ